MKKIIFALLPMVLFFSGCKMADNLTLLKQNMSELNEVYFMSLDEQMFVTITSGQREEPYIYDGKSCDKLDFALVNARLEGDDMELATISINGQVQNVIMQFNFVTGLHFVDLEKRLDGSEKITFEYMGKKVEMQCLSDDFVVDHNKALEIAYENLKNEVDALCDDGEFKGEAYLRVANYLEGGKDKVVWLFSLLDGKKQMKNLVISTLTPQILADGKQVMI